MTDEEALACMERGDNALQSSQQMLARLQRLGWIVCDDITTLDSTDARVLKFIEVTARGQEILKKRRH